MDRHPAATRVAILVVITACHRSSGDTKRAPAALDSLRWFSNAPTWLRVANVHRPGLRIDLQLARTTVTAGDSLELVAVARNSTSVPIQVGRSCGPAMDVRITAPTGQTASVIMLGMADPLHTMFTCELGPYH